MAKSTALNFTQEIEVKGLQLTSANTTTAATLYSVATNDAVVKSLTATSDDTSAVNLRVFINDGTTDFLLDTVRVATLAGTDGAAANVDILNDIAGLPRDLNSRPVLLLRNGHTLKVGALATITAAKTVNVVAQIEEY